MTKEKLVDALNSGNIRLWNRYRDWLRHFGVYGANLDSANLDYSCWPLWCGSLSAKVDQKIVIQLLYHAAMPTQANETELDDDVEELLDSDLFRRVVAKFHRSECDRFVGANEKLIKELKDENI